MSRPPAAPARGTSVSVWVGRLGTLLYLPILFVGLRDRETTLPTPSVDDLRSVRDVVALVNPLLLALLWPWVLHVPLGFLLALAFPPRPTAIDRLARVFLPALVAGTLLAAATHVFLTGAPWSWPSAPELVLPVLGVAFGAWAGSAWSGGWRARRRFVASLTALAIVAVLGLAYAATLVFETSPLGFAPTPVTSAEKRRIYQLFKGKNPTILAEGRTETLSLTPHDLNLLVAWGLSLGEAERKAEVRLDTGHATLSASARIPGRRYVNVVSGAGLAVEDGRLQMGVDTLRIGRLEVPGWILRFVSPAVVGAVARDPRVKQALVPVRAVSIDPSSARFVYGHGELPSGFVADLFHGEGSGGEDLPVAQAHARHLIQVAGKLPTEGEARFGAALQAAFAFAAERSRKGDAVRENRGAILALGILIGRAHVEKLVGPVLDKDELAAGLHAYRGLRVRNRNDWTKHFTVSSALTVLSATSVSNAVGVFKEELDATGGSEGFSFGDLMADRSGTRLAEAATRDEVSARAIQARLAGGFKVDDFFPPAVDLPEDMRDAEFQARFGGVGGAEYKRVMGEIERRLALCPAYAQAPVVGR
jgi:hypothetical protein